MNNTIKDLPKDDRPREKALKYGINVLSNSELIAVILGSGTKNHNVLEVSQNILKSVENLSDLTTYSLKKLCEFEGVNKVRALQLQAAILLGLRMQNKAEECLTLKAYNSEEIYQKYKAEILENFQEKALFIFINNLGKEIGIKEFSGNTFNINIDFNVIKQLFNEFKPKKLVIIHTHIDGNSEPSLEDINLTIFMQNFCENEGVILLDHLIISKHNYFSFKDQKFFNN